MTVTAATEGFAAGIVAWAFWINRNLELIQNRAAVAGFLDKLRTTATKVGQDYPRFCPICEMQRVWLSWLRGGDPVVACGSCGWAFDTDWEELLNATGISSRSS